MNDKPKENLCQCNTFECGATRGCEEFCKHFEERSSIPQAEGYPKCKFKSGADEGDCWSVAARLEEARTAVKDLEEQLDYQGESVTSVPVQHGTAYDYFCPACKKNLDESWEYCAACGVKLDWSIPIPRKTK